MESWHTSLQQAIGRVARADADQTSCGGTVQTADLSLEQAQTQWQLRAIVPVRLLIQEVLGIKGPLEEADRAVSGRFRKSGPGLQRT